MLMRLFNWIGLLLTVHLVACGSGDPAKPLPDNQVEHLDWGLLTPKDWDAMDLLKGIDLSKMQDNDPQAMELLADVGKAWTDAPIVEEMDGKRGSLMGYVVPLGGDITHIREFLLVPYFGACIHTPPPPSNQIVHVRVEGQGISMAGWDAAVMVDGVLRVVRSETALGTAGYTMSAEFVRPFKDTLQSSEGN